MATSSIDGRVERMYVAFNKGRCFIRVAPITLLQNWQPGAKK
jgi:hypothetical protein